MGLFYVLSRDVSFFSKGKTLSVPFKPFAKRWAASIEMNSPSVKCV